MTNKGEALTALQDAPVTAPVGAWRDAACCAVAGDIRPLRRVSWRGATVASNGAVTLNATSVLS